MPEQVYKVIIIGAGPAGLSAAARAQANQLDYLLLEKGELVNTFYEEYAYGKFVQDFPSTSRRVVISRFMLAVVRQYSQDGARMRANIN